MMDYLAGIDLGSTTTKAVLIRSTDNALLASVYLRTSGDPVGASRQCYRSILEQVLLDTMYELPTMENVSKVVIDEPTVLGEGKPLLIYSDPPKVAGSLS